MDNIYFVSLFCNRHVSKIIKSQKTVINLWDVKYMLLWCKHVTNTIVLFACSKLNLRYLWWHCVISRHNYFIDMFSKKRESMTKTIFRITVISKDRFIDFLIKDEYIVLLVLFTGVLLGKVYNTGTKDGIHCWLWVKVGVCSIS